MAEKQFNTRIINKHDTATNWAKATNFIPKKGELIVYDADTTNTQPRLKIGDGTTTVINLPFVTDITDVGAALAALGLSGAMKFLGTSATAITDGATTNPITIGSTSTTVASGNVVLYGSKEFVWNGSAWEELGNEGSYKVQQSAVSSPSASGSTTAFIDTISQNAQGVITATKKNVTFPTLSGGSAATADATVVGGVTVSGHAVTVGKKTLTAGSNVTITGAADKITIAATDTNTNYYHTPDYNSGLKLASGTGVNNLYVPEASDSQKGVTVVYPAAQCTTYTSDTGTVTPAAVKKAVETFGVLNTGDSISGNLTFSNPNATNQSGHPHLVWNAIGANTPYIGYATDQSDGTFIVSSIKGTEYSTGLAIGGGSGNLLWKGQRVATASDLPGNASTSAAGLMSAADKTKLDGITTSADTVAFTQNATSGNKVGTITINGTATDMYSPTQTSVSGNAGTATTLKTARTIDGVSFNGSAAIIHYGECSTAAATVAKTVALTGFSLVTGARIAVKFTVTNTAANPTLNVNSTGAKAIMYRGSAITASYLAANRVYEFIYDGTDWELIGDINTDTNTKVTSAANHYTPAADSSAALSVDASSSTAATWGTTSLVTGVNLQRDAKGHVTGVTVDSIKMPSNPNSNTTYTLSGAASGNTWVTTLTPSSGSATTSTVPAATTSAAGLMTAAMVTKLNGIATGATANTGTITGVSANGTSIATSGVANIPAASTSAYGVTKLSSATNSTSTTLAATASAVKSAYDLANTANTTVNAITAITTAKINEICV